MKRILLVILFVVSQIAFAQKLNIQSGRISLDIKFAPKDSIAPKLTIISPTPNIIKGLPVYQRDSVAEIIGKATDNEEVAQLIINGKHPESFINNKFIAYVPLSKGLNKIVVKAIDEQNNVTSKELSIYQDKNQDIYPPEIDLSSSIKGRGINVVPVTFTNDSVFIRGEVKDSSPLYGVWVNDSAITLTKQSKFLLAYKTVPESLNFKAIDKYGNISQKSFAIENGNITNSDTTLPGKYYALLIANQNYKSLSISDLDYPIKNAESLLTTLTTNYTFNKKDIILLKNPTRSKIIQTLDRLSEKITKDDNLLIFYAGHGVWEKDLQQGFWLPSDATLSDKSEWLSNGIIRDYIRGINSKHTLLITDACFGGAIFKSRDVLLNAPVSIRKMYDIPSRTAMTSGALTAVPDESVFIKYLINRLDTNQNKYLPAENLYYDIRQAVINNSPTYQMPEFGVIYQSGDQGGGSFIFIHK